MAAVVQVKFVVSDAEGLAKLSNWKNQVQSLGSGSSGPLSITGKGFSDFGREAQRAGGLTNVFRESIHTLHPILESAGVEMGIFGALARAAGGGLTALAVGAIGAAAVALARLGDQSIVARKRLSDVLGTAALGDKTFARLQERAKGSGTDVSALARPLEDLQAATKFGSPFRAAPGKEGALPGAQNINQQIDGLTALFQTMRTGAASEAEAAEGLAKFTGALRAQVEEGKKAQLTAQMVADLARVAPGAANALAQAFNRPDAQAFEESLRKAPIAIDQLVPALARMAGAAGAAFNDPAKHIKTFTDSLGDVKHEFDNLVKSLTGDDLSGFMAKQMEGVKAGIQATEQDINALIKIWQKLKELGKADPETGVGRMIDEKLGRRGPGATFSERFGQWGKPETSDVPGARIRPSYPSAHYDPATARPGLPYGHTFPDSSVPELPGPGAGMSQGYGDAPFSVLDPILSKHGLIPLGKMLEYQGYVRHGNSWSPDAVYDPSKSQLGVGRGLGGGSGPLRLAPLGPYEGPNRITIPRPRSDLGSPSPLGGPSGAPPGATSGASTTELTTHVHLHLDGREIVDEVVRQAVDEKLHQIVPRQSAAQ